MVGHCKNRSYYTHIEGLSTRSPAWNLDLPGRAIKCWAHKNNSVAWVLVEDDAGVQKVYSGCDFVDHYENSILQLLGRGKFPQRYGEQDIRAAFAPMKFPESTTIKKISS